MLVRKSLKIDDEVEKTALRIAAEDSTSFTQVVESAIKMYSDYRYMGEKATLINQDVQKTFDARMALLETRLNQKSNKLLSELAIQQAIICQILTRGLDINPSEVEKYRVLSVEFLKSNNRVLRFDEVVSDA